jgi:hypothetical protein
MTHKNKTEMLVLISTYDERISSTKGAMTVSTTHEYAGGPERRGVTYGNNKEIMQYRRADSTNNDITIASAITLIPTVRAEALSLAEAALHGHATTLVDNGAVC